MKNIFVLDKNYKKIGTLSNEGANPQAPYYEDLYTQELETGADTYQFSTTSSKYTQDILEIGNHIMFAYKNKYELFTIASLEYSHYEGYKTIGVYAEGIGFDLLEVYMERPEVPEKEENKDNGGSDKVYIDEDGNIIYDPDGDGETGGDITIDGDGNIIYTPSKNNKKNDSLEFKNISYPRFLSMLLKNSGWSYSCQPGLESVKHDITVRYDTNIYAILQDSMQAYRGVELQFSYAMMGGQVHKIIMAYKDGGRGSFVGKRFEYGTNVRGITKTQEVTDLEDDTVIRVDNVGVDVYYDIDFALKSAEIPEIEIGDTHYVIDKQFHPPMTIKARIGKIEVSFSDPTKNKITVANNKKIRGSAIEDEFDEDDIKDIIDDYDDDIVDPDTPMTPAASSDNLIKAPRIHAHEFLVYVNDDHMQNDLGITEVNVPTTGLPPSAFYDYIMDEGNIIVMGTPDDLGAIAAKNGIEPSNDSQPCLRLLSKRACSYDAYGDPNNGSCYQTEVQRSIFSTIINEDTDKDDFGYYTREKNNHGDEHLLDVCSLTCATILALRQHLKKDHGGGSSTGGEDGGNVTTFDNLHINKWLTMGSETAPMGASTAIKMVDSRDELSMYPSGINTTGGITCKDVIAKDLSASGDMDANRARIYNGGLYVFSKAVFPDGSYVDADGWHNGEPPSGGNPPTDPGAGEGGDNPGTGGGTITDGFDIVSGNQLFVDKIDAKAIEVAQLEVTHRLYAKDIVAPSISHMDSAEIDAIKTGAIDVGVKAKIKEIEFPDGSTLTSANGLSGEGVTPGTGGGNLDGLIDAVEVDNEYTDTGKDIDLHVRKPTYFDGPIYMTGEWNSWGGASNHFTSIYGVGQLETMIINCDCWRPNDIYKDVTFYGNVIVDGTITHKGLVNNSDISKKENIRYINNQAVQKENLETRNYSNEDLLEKADLHDFIVNQVNICEYNFIGDTANKIGFIANDYEGTKVGDKIVSKQEFKERNDDGEIIEISESLVYDADNLLFATIGALQEEVRIKDEEIASLKDRLAKIEAMLGINNDN